MSFTTKYIVIDAAEEDDPIVAVDEDSEQEVLACVASDPDLSFVASFWSDEASDFGEGYEPVSVPEFIAERWGDGAEHFSTENLESALELMKADGRGHITFKVDRELSRRNRGKEKRTINISGQPVKVLVSTPGAVFDFFAEIVPKPQAESLIAHKCITCKHWTRGLSGWGFCENVEGPPSPVHQGFGCEEHSFGGQK